MDGSRFLPPARALTQTDAFCRALNLVGVDAGQVISTEGSAVVIRRGPVRLVSRGPVWPDESTEVDRAALLRQLARGGPLIVNANAPEDSVPLRGAGFRRIMTPVYLASWSLEPDPEELRRRMAGSFRNGLRRAERSNLVVSHMTYRHKRDNWLLDKEAEQQRRAGYRAWPTSLVPALAAELADDARLLVARRSAKGDPIAAVLILRHGPVATYHIGWTSPEGRSAQAHSLLLTRAALWLARRGVSVLELGTVTTSAPGQMRFKLSTGATTRALGGSWLRLLPPFSRP